MQEPEPPPDEAERLRALERYAILDTLPEPLYDDLVALAAHVAGTPIALISLVDEKRQWFKARVGLGATETPRSVSFCGHVVQDGELLVIPDARLDARFHDNPLVTGEPHVTFYAGAPVVTEDGFTLGTLCVIDSAPRELPGETLLMLERLARQVASQLELRRSLQRAEAQRRALEEAREQALRASATKSAFLTSMSHELRTPLNSVLGFARVLSRNARGALSEKELGYLERIDANGRHLLALIDDLLDLSRIEAGELRLDVHPLPLDALVEGVTTQLRGAAEASGTPLDHECPRGLAPIESDARRLKQILINLLGNALKFGAGSPVHLRVVADPDEPSRAIRVEVEDHGPGIPAAHLESIFEAFRQVDEEADRVHGGTGLGLAISRRLADALGMRLGVTSREGLGSVFWLALVPGAPPPAVPG